MKDIFVDIYSNVDHLLESCRFLAPRLTDDWELDVCYSLLDTLQDCLVELYKIGDTNALLPSYIDKNVSDL